MTADNPDDFPYVPVHEPADPAVRAGYWRTAMGLQEVDGLHPSAYAKQLVREHVEGMRGIEETGELLRLYYRERRAEEAPRSDAAAPSSCAAEREADLVSQRIVEVLSRNAFAFSPFMLSDLHRQLFGDLDAALYHPGEYKRDALVKSELVLNGDSVLYADPSMIARALAFAFDDEQDYAYAPDFDAAQTDHLARFIARLWQVHPFCEGNTRTVAVFAFLYLRHLGFDADNEPFERHARYFRDALVRANYRNAKAGAMPERRYLVAFLENLLCGAHHELRNRELMVRALFDDPSLLRNVDPSQALTRNGIDAAAVLG